MTVTEIHFLLWTTQPGRHSVSNFILYSKGRYKILNVRDIWRVEFKILLSPDLSSYLSVFRKYSLFSWNPLCLYCVVCCLSLSVKQTLIEVWWTKYFLSIINIVSLDVIRKELIFDICTALVRLVVGHWSRVWWLLDWDKLHREHPEVLAGRKQLGWSLDHVEWFL